MSKRLTIICFASDGLLYELTQTAPSGSWTGWQKVGGPTGGWMSTHIVTANHDGRLELVTTDARSGYIWQVRQTSQYGAWPPMARVADPPGATFTDGNAVLMAGQDGRLEFFVSSATNEVWHRWQTTVNGGWSNWLSHGTPPNVQQLVLLIAITSSKRLMVLAATASPGTTTEEFHTWQLLQNAPNGTWSSWVAIPTPTPRRPLLPELIWPNLDGRLEAFGFDGTDESACHMWQEPGGAAWSAWKSEGKPPGRQLWDVAALAASKDGRLELFAADTTGELWHMWQVAPGGSWSTWLSHGRPGGGLTSSGLDLSLAASDDGRLEAFAIGQDGNLWHMWQTSPNGSWSSWISHSRPAGLSWVASPTLVAS